MPTKRVYKPKPSTLLKRALALFGPRGKHWTKGTYRRDPSEGHPNGEFCAVGALNKVNTARQQEAVVYLGSAVRSIYITKWNDARHRKWSDIRAAFTKAMKLAKAAGN